MRSPAQELAAQIREEIPYLDREERNVQTAWTRAQLAVGTDEMLLRATALSLHAFYSGLERLFERIARRVDGHLPDGEAWHRDLLVQMAAEIPGRRPAILERSDVTELQAYLGFRHVVRNIYTENLIPGRIRDLVDALPSIWRKVRTQLEAFADLLNQ